MTTASFRPRGVGRYFGAVFLLVWLAGWVVGELAALWVLGAIAIEVSGVASLPLPASLPQLSTGGGLALLVLFLLLWLGLWTLGGYAASTQLFRSLAGEDVIALRGSAIVLVRRAGPFARRRQFERRALRRVRMRPHDKALVLDTTDATHVLTEFGSVDERERAATWLISTLSLKDDQADSSASPPPAWEVASRDGLIVVRKSRRRDRTVRSIVAWCAAGLVALGWATALASDPSALGLPWLAVSMALAAAAATSTWGRSELTIRRGELTFRRSVAAYTSERTFHGAQLEVTHSRDSDRDSHYKLIARDAEGERTVHTQINDSIEVVDLGHWLAARTGFPISLAHDLRPHRR